jgi:hypothetical protein
VSAIVFAVAWKKRGWSEALERAYGVERLLENGVPELYIDREGAMNDLPGAGFEYEYEAESDVLNVRGDVVLGLTADRGAAARTELPLADRSIILDEPSDFIQRKTYVGVGKLQLKRKWEVVRRERNWIELKAPAITMRWLYLMEKYKSKKKI